MNDILIVNVRQQLKFLRDCVRLGQIPFAALLKAKEWEKRLDELIKELESLMSVRGG